MTTRQEAYEALDAIEHPKYLPGVVAALKAVVERLHRCMSMTMGCLDNFSHNVDERLAWYRLLDGVERREPRAAIGERASGGESNG